MTYAERAKKDILEAKGLGYFTGLFYKFSGDRLLTGVDKRNWEKIKQVANDIKHKYPGSQFRVFNYSSGVKEIFGNKIFSEACDKEEVFTPCWNINIWGTWAE